MVRNTAIQLSFALFLGILPSQAAVITVEASSPVVVLGTPVSVEVGVTGIMGTDVGVYDLDVNFDPTVLSFTSVTFGDPVLGDELNLFGYGSATNVDASNAASGSVEVSELAFDSPQDLQSYQPPAFGLFTVGFDTVGGGSTAVSSTVNVLGDGGGNSLNYSYGPPATIDVAVLTPEPSAFGLFAIGLGIIAMLFRRMVRV